MISLVMITMILGMMEIRVRVMVRIRVRSIVRVRSMVRFMVRVNCVC